MCSFEVWLLKQHISITGVFAPFPDLLNLNPHLNNSLRCTLMLEVHALENGRATRQEELEPPGPWSMPQVRPSCVRNKYYNFF